MTPRQALLTVLDEEHADAVLKYRKGMERLRKAPFTEFAAKRLASRFAACADPNAAAAYMIDRGWQGFNIDWTKGEIARAWTAPVSQMRPERSQPKPSPEPTPEERQRVAAKAKRLVSDVLSYVSPISEAEQQRSRELARKREEWKRNHANLRHEAAGR